jgi:hypothetical protein
LYDDYGPDQLEARGALSPQAPGAGPPCGDNAGKVFPQVMFELGNRLGRPVCSPGLFAAALTLSALLTWTAPASAYSWMIRHDYFGCKTCHADPSGGGLLTRYGRVQGDLLLRMRYGGKTTSETGESDEDFESFDDFDDFDEQEGAGIKEPAAAAAAVEASVEPNEDPLWGLVETPSWLLLSGAYRHMTLYQVRGSDRVRTFPMQLDVYGQVSFGLFKAGGSIGLARVPASSPHARRAQVTTGQGESLNMLSRTHWVGASFAGGEIEARLGRLEMPFGVRIPEHTMWVRDSTRTDRESDQQHGASVAYSGDFLRGELLLIAGNYQLNPDALRERGYSMYAEVQPVSWAAVGVSSLVTRADADFETLDRDVTRQAHGIFGRVNPFKPLVIFVEADALLKTRRDLGYVGLLQLDYELIQGLHAGAAGEILDSGFQDTGDPFNTLRKAAGFGRPRLGGWLTVDWYFLPQLEARFDVVRRQNDPLMLFAQLHAYL